MKKKFLSFFALVSLFIASCNNSGNDLAGKKEKLEKKKTELAALSVEVQQLEDQIAKEDPSSVKKEKTKLVATQAVSPESFTHYIDLQGKIDALNIAFVTPRNGTGGQVTAIYVKKGDAVKKGQLLLKLDDALLRQQLAQAKLQLSYAKNLYERRNNLWKEKIGTEVDLINARNMVDQAQKQVDIVNEQIGLTDVYADISGVADDVNIRIGEFFTGNNQIKIVNTENLKAVTQVPENYLGKVMVGSNVKVVLPEINNKTINTKVSVSGKLIDPTTRGFYIEARIPYDKDFHPNQIALIKIQDYTVSNAITIPANTVQNDEKGKYVMVAVKEGSRMTARKKPITIGQMYEDKIEVKSGVAAGDFIITDGYQGLYDGQPITTQAS
jgi:membrane fusion protein, multidrug efflux system